MAFIRMMIIFSTGATVDAESTSYNIMANSERNLSQPRRTDPVESTPLLPNPSPQRYSVFTTAEKRLLILAAALASAFSPLSANIYYPALNSIAQDLKVSTSKINLTITTYMVQLTALDTYVVLTRSLKARYARAPPQRSPHPLRIKPVADRHTSAVS